MFVVPISHSPSQAPSEFQNLWFYLVKLFKMWSFFFLFPDAVVKTGKSTSLLVCKQPVFFQNFLMAFSIIILNSVSWWQMISTFSFSFFFSSEQFRVELKVLNWHFWVIGSIHGFSPLSVIVWWAFSLCLVRKCLVSEAYAWGWILDFPPPPFDASLCWKWFVCSVHG